MRAGYSERLRGKSNPNYKHGPKFCSGCGKKSSRNAKGDRCFKCIDLKGANNPFFGCCHTEETKRLMALNHYDCSGELNPFWGKRHSDTARRKMSQKQIAAMQNPTRRQIAKQDLRKGLQTQLQQHGGTVPERLVAKSLDNLAIRYITNVLLYDKFYVDFLLEDECTIIEVFGDYWHGNLRTFPNLTHKQQCQQRRDKSRISYLEQCSNIVIVLWERDIKENCSLVKEVLQNESPHLVASGCPE